MTDISMKNSSFWKRNLKAKNRENRLECLIVFHKEVNLYRRVKSLYQFETNTDIVRFSAAIQQNNLKTH